MRDFQKKNKPARIAWAPLQNGTVAFQSLANHVVGFLTVTPFQFSDWVLDKLKSCLCSVHPWTYLDPGNKGPQMEKSKKFAICCICRRSALSSVDKRSQRNKMQQMGNFHKKCHGNSVKFTVCLLAHLNRSTHQLKHSKQLYIEPPVRPTLVNPGGPGGRPPLPPRFCQNHAVFRQFSGETPIFSTFWAGDIPWG